MSPGQTLICLVSASHLSSNPRLVKEADTLHAAGYRVHVVAGRNFPLNDPLDALILAEARWTCTIVDYHSGLRARGQRLIRRLARLILAHTARTPLWLASRAHHPAADQLARTARRIGADFYIGHTLVGLTAAAWAARKTGARLGFDAEDFHSLETDAAIALPEERHSIHRLESTLLPRCIHLTAAAPLIARAYAETYGIAQPITVQNAFPLSEAPAAPREDLHLSPPVRFYWVSQTIGPGRGLEAVIRTLAQMRMPATLSMRGNPSSAAYPDALRQHARESGFTGNLHFLPAAPAAEMARLAAEHDIALAIELQSPPNRDLCLSNKLYTYLLAGVPLACTPTRAQRAFATNIGDAALIVDLEDPAAAARQLDSFLSDPSRYAAARRSAWHLGRTRFNWETERPILLAAVQAALQRPRPGPAPKVWKEFIRGTLRTACRFLLRARSRPLQLSSQGPALVLAPHADDEALGCGALLAARCAAGAEIHVAYFTDGAAGLSKLTSDARAALALQRRQEAVAAMGTLGLGEDHLHFLNAPDGRLKDLTGTERAHWEAALRQLITRVRPAEILLPGRADGSSEHEAMFRLLATALPGTGLQPRVLEFPVWSWWNPRFLWPTVCSAHRVWRQPVAPHGDKKARLLRSYPSQTTLMPAQAEPALSPDFLAAFDTPDEFFFETKLPS